MAKQVGSTENRWKKENGQGILAHLGEFRRAYFGKRALGVEGELALFYNCSRWRGIREGNSSFPSINVEFCSSSKTPRHRH